MLRFPLCCCLLGAATGLQVAYKAQVPAITLRANTALSASRPSKMQPLVDCLAAAENSAEELACLVPFDESPAPAEWASPAEAPFVYDAQPPARKITPEEREMILGSSSGVTRTDCLASAESWVEIDECHMEYPESTLIDEQVVDALDQMVANSRRERESRKAAKAEAALVNASEQATAVAASIFALGAKMAQGVISRIF